MAEKRINLPSLDREVILIIFDEEESEGRNGKLNNLMEMRLDFMYHLVYSNVALYLHTLF